MLNCEDILSQFVSPTSQLWPILLTHSRCVADLAVRIALAHPELSPDIDFVREAAMLHDVGVVQTDAPSIYCFGSLPYICHGIAGRQLLDSVNLPRHALVCERHTGSGLTTDYIVANNLPLPQRDMTPQSVEEKIVCFADKFFSKSKNLTQQKSFERALSSVAKYGDDSRQRFLQLDQLLHIDTLQ